MARMHKKNMTYQGDFLKSVNLLVNKHKNINQDIYVICFVVIKKIHLNIKIC